MVPTGTSMEWRTWGGHLATVVFDITTFMFNYKNYIQFVCKKREEEIFCQGVQISTLNSNLLLMYHVGYRESSFLMGTFTGDVTLRPVFRFILVVTHQRSLLWRVHATG